MNNNLGSGKTKQENAVSEVNAVNEINAMNAVNNTNPVIKDPQSQHSHPKVKINETYGEVNRTSFQKNFKFLIGHYKEEDRSSPADSAQLS
jgi:hypothetical protein